MRVTVLVPVWNEPAGRIRSAVVSSIFAGADQVVVVDDGSAEPVELPIGATGFTELALIRQEHRGIAAALNRGREAARGKHLCWLSCGDAMTGHKLTEQLAFMGVTGARASFHDYRVAGGVHRVAPDWRQRIWTDNQFSLSTMMVEGETWDFVGGFDESLTWCSDWDFACRVEASTGWWYLPLVLGEAYEHADGHTARAMADPELAAARGRDRATVSKRWRRGPCV
jgi:glycosyltransferase involved in cell wall biosynthesis